MEVIKAREEKVVWGEILNSEEWKSVSKMMNNE